MISALRQGNTGNEILQILDAITDGEKITNEAVTYKNSPTLDVIDFWDYQQFL